MARAHIFQVGWKLVATVLLLSAMAVGAVASSMAPEASEVRVKAAFVYNFAKFVEWPPDAFSSPDSPIVIGVVNDTLFATVLEETVSGKLIDRRSIRVRQLASEADVKSSRIHVLYIPSTADRLTPSALATVAGSSVLTIGDSDRFTRTGGIIRFLIQDARMRFEINPDAAERAHLKVSAKLLALARIVRGTSAER